MSKSIPVDCSELALPDLDVIASETTLVIRKSPKFSPGGFLQSLLSSVATGQGSLNQIASELGTRGPGPGRDGPPIHVRPLHYKVHRLPHGRDLRLDGATF